MSNKKPNIEEEEEEEKSGAGWIVSFADLMTLLFCAFVVLYGIIPHSETDEIIGVITSIRESFIEIPEEIPDESRLAEISEGKLSFNEARRDSTLNPAIKKFNRNKNILRAKSQKLDQIEVLLNEKSRGKGVHFSLRKATEVERHEFGFRLRMLSSAYFQKGSYKLTNKGKKHILTIGKLLKSTNPKLIIEGHTDSIPSTDNYNNLELSSLRASHVKKLLEKNVKIKSDNIKIASYGDLHPVASNSVKRGRDLNNRVEIKISYQDKYGL